MKSFNAAKSLIKCQINQMNWLIKTWYNNSFYFLVSPKLSKIFLEAQQLNYLEVSPWYFSLILN